MKESKSYKISIEGEVCEKLYFEHLEMLINNCNKALYKAKFFVKKKNPLSFAKSRSNIYASKGNKHEGFIKYFHIQDIEDYYDNFQKEKFFNLIDEINETKKVCNISVYELGYSNFTFDLWMVLHKCNLISPVSDRYQYYTYINKAYNKSYLHMDDYKGEAEFKSCISQITLDDAIQAIDRSKKIRKRHKDNKDHLESHGRFSFYRDNPDLTINDIVEEILKDCGVIWKNCIFNLYRENNNI